MPGYYDGDTNWRVGFMPTTPGSWNYRTSSPDPDLDGHTGTVQAAASDQRGLLAGDPAHPDKWRYADGTFVVPIGVFANAMLDDATEGEFVALADFLRDNELQLLNFRLSEHDLAFTDVGGRQMDLGLWRRLERRLEILTERGLGVDVMLYTDDAGRPSFGPRSDAERLLIRYAVARLASFPVVLFNSGIDLSEYRDAAWVDWYGEQVRGLDPYGHPVSSRYGSGSGGRAMVGQTYNSVGDRNSTMSGLLAAYARGDGVPAANNDNFSEDLDGLNGHTREDIRRTGWKATVAGGVAFHVRHNTLYCPRGITECDRYFPIAQAPSLLDAAGWLRLVNPFVRDRLGATFGEMEPDAALVDGAGAKYALADGARTRILVLLLGNADTWDRGDGGPVTVRLGGVSGTFDASWFDPRTGGETTAGAVEGGADRVLSPPNGDDWLLLLRRR